MASLTQWTWVGVDSSSWWWTGWPGVLWFMGSQRVRHNWETELIWTCHRCCTYIFSCHYHTVLITAAWYKSWSQSFNCALFLYYCVGYLGSSASPFKLQAWLLDVHKRTCWNFDLHCNKSVIESRKNWHLDNRVFLSTNMEYLFIYLVLLWFISLELYSFPHTDLKHILVYLYFSISFLWVLILIELSFKFQIPLFMASI